MRLCFDATRFGFGLDDALTLAVQKGIPAVEFSFAPFSTFSKNQLLDDAESQYLHSLRVRSKQQNIEFACFNLDSCLVPQDKRSGKKFQEMIIKLGHVAQSVDCHHIAVSILPSVEDGWLDSASEQLKDMQAALAKHDVHLFLRLATPNQLQGQSLKQWQAMEPQDWRDLIAQCPGLSLSFSPADCVWLGIDYLQILPGLVKAIDHIEAHDIEINRSMLTDSGLFGPIWWRYRIPGKGQVDWRQFIEALKLYEFNGTFSIHLDDEFVGDQFEDLDNALDLGIKELSPLLKG